MNLTKEAKLILKEVASRSNPFGTVMHVHGLDGSVEFIVNNRKHLIRDALCSDIDTCESALEELITQGLLVKVKHHPNLQMFEITKKGRKYAESLAP